MFLVAKHTACVTLVWQSLQMSVDDDDFETKIRSLFKEMDTDSSTSLDPTELAAAVQAINSSSTASLLTHMFLAKSDRAQFNVPCT